MTLHQYSRREFLSRAAAAGLAVSFPARGHAIPAGLDSLAELSATAAIAAIKQGEITAEIYARALLDRAGRLQNLNAFRTLVPDKVLEAARAADKLRASGARLGALHGLPVPVKDSVNTAGYPTSNGTAALRDFRPDADARVLTPLLAAGAIVMGKTNLHELSLGWTSNNATFGPVHNPYDSARVPGGSSGGSAVAVAARMAPLAIAEDTLGSIRIPSTMCGIYGFRPTYERYSNVGIMALTDNKFDQVGPLARTVGDIALFDAVITGEKSPLERVDLKGVRIGVADFFFSDVDAEVERVTNEALDRLRAAGVTIVRADLPDAAKGAPAAALTIIASEVRPSIEAFLKAQRTGLSFEALVAQVGPDLKPLFAAAPPPRDVYDAMVAQRTKIREGIKAHFAEHNVEALAFPPAMIPAHEIGENGSVTVRGQLVSGTTTMGRNVSPGSCASLASLVVPAGLTRAGLPVGLEFDALPGTDRRLLALGLAVERVLGSIPAPQLG
jgi:Asp-tRNA(Asn)/Glu-tRNA(Gln) amidotransferase A subunit family amidase